MRRPPCLLACAQIGIRSAWPGTAGARAADAAAIAVLGGGAVAEPLDIDRVESGAGVGVHAE